MDVTTLPSSGKLLLPLYRCAENTNWYTLYGYIFVTAYCTGFRLKCPNENIITSSKYGAKV